MKTKILLTLLFLSTSLTAFCTTWTIVNSGTTFSPETITIKVGDSVNFVLASIHNATEVDQTIWNANGNTALSGGFQTPHGGGLILPAQLGVGTHYYVCQPHASLGMKGQIIVENATGIPEKQLQTIISVFPNPATDLITVKASKDILGLTFIIRDQIGRQVLTGKLNNEITSVDISELATGVYLFQIGEQKRQTFKVIKK